MYRIGLIGAGAVGQALAYAMSEAGIALQCVIDRSAVRARELAHAVGALRSGADYRLICADVELLIAAIPDDQLPRLDRSLSRQSLELRINAFVHTAGAIPGSVMAGLQRKGVSVGSIHPLQTFPKQGPPPSMRGLYFSVEGDESLLVTLKALVQSLGGIPIVIPAEKKAVYHAAAVFAANFLPVLLHESLELLSLAGIQKDIGRKMVAPLMRRSLDNCLSRGVSEAITGPVMRGDSETIRLHLEALRELSADAYIIYRILSLKLLEVAVERGLPSADADRIHELLTG